MNNKLEVIGIDHGWSMMKTVTQVFVTGVKEITTTPALFGDVLEYDGKYYKIGTVRQYELNAQLDLENAKAMDADLGGPDEEKSEDRIENAGIVAEDKGIYMPDRNRKR